MVNTTGSDGIVGWQASLEVQDLDNVVPVAATYRELGEVTSIDPADPQYDEAEFTHLRLAVPRKVFKPTFADGGEVAVEMNALFSDADQNKLVDIRDAGASGARNWKIVWRENKPASEAPAILRQVIFPGYIKSFKPGTTATTDAVKRNLTIRVTGAETWS